MPSLNLRLDTAHMVAGFEAAHCSMAPHATAGLRVPHVAPLAEHAEPTAGQAAPASVVSAPEPASCGAWQTMSPHVIHHFSPVPPPELEEPPLDPDELGAACAFLCSAHAGYITGQNLLIDGGVFPGAF